jgi:hypothetical protein
MKTLGRVLPCTLLLLAGATALPAGDKKGEDGPVVVELDGLQSKTPAEWQKQKPANRLRSHQFKLPKAKDDPADAEVAISPEQRGTPEQSVERWKELFELPADLPKEEAPKVDTFKIGKVKATYLDIRGTYYDLPRPLAPKTQAKLRQNYRMLAVFLETGGDKFFIRMIGPAKTVAQYKPGFDAWLKGLK